MSAFPDDPMYSSVYKMIESRRYIALITATHQQNSALFRCGRGADKDDLDALMSSNVSELFYQIAPFLEPGESSADGMASLINLMPEELFRINDITLRIALYRSYCRVAAEILDQESDTIDELAQAVDEPTSCSSDYNGTYRKLQLLKRLRTDRLNAFKAIGASSRNSEALHTFWETIFIAQFFIDSEGWCKRLFQLGTVLFDQGDFKEAKQTFEQIVDFPGVSKNLEAIEQRESQAKKRAIPILREEYLRILDGVNPVEVLFDKASILFDLGEYDLAEQIFNQIPDYPGAKELVKDLTEQLNEQKCEEALRLQAKGRYSEALDLLEQIPDCLRAKELIQGLIEERKGQKYKEALQLQTEGKYKEALELLDGIPDYPQVASLVDELVEQVNQPIYRKAIQLREEKDFSEAEQLFAELGAYSDSAKQLELTIKMRQYSHALDLINQGELNEAEHILKGISGYPEVVEKLREIAELKSQMKYDEACNLLKRGKALEAAHAFEDLGEWRDSATLAVRAKEHWREVQYESAVRLRNQNLFDDTCRIFKELGAYSDAAQQLVVTKKEQLYSEAEKLSHLGMHDRAAEMYQSLGDYKYAKELVDVERELHAKKLESDYKNSIKLMTSGNYAEASNMFSSLGDYKDAQVRRGEADRCESIDAQYGRAVNLFSLGYYGAAAQLNAPVLSTDIEIIKKKASRLDSAIKRAEALASENTSLYARASTLKMEISKLYKAIGNKQRDRRELTECEVQLNEVSQNIDNLSQDLHESHGFFSFVDRMLIKSKIGRLVTQRSILSDRVACERAQKEKEADDAIGRLNEEIKEKEEECEAALQTIDENEREIYALRKRF